MTSRPTTPADRAAAVLAAAEAASAAGEHPAPGAPPQAPPHAPGAADRLLRAADELDAGVAGARAQLDDLQAALARLVR